MYLSNVGQAKITKENMSYLEEKNAKIAKEYMSFLEATNAPTIKDEPMV